MNKTICLIIILFPVFSSCFENKGKQEVAQSWQYTIYKPSHYEAFEIESEYMINLKSVEFEGLHIDLFVYEVGLRSSVDSLWLSKYLLNSNPLIEMRVGNRTEYIVNGIGSQSCSCSIPSDPIKGHYCDEILELIRAEVEGNKNMTIEEVVSLILNEQ